jgi:hypothetical protein
VICESPRESATQRIGISDPQVGSMSNEQAGIKFFQRFGTADSLETDHACYADSTAPRVFVRPKNLRFEGALIPVDNSCHDAIV